MVPFHPTPASFALVQKQIRRAATICTLALVALVPAIATAKTEIDVATADVDLLDVMPLPDDGNFEVLHRASSPSMTSGEIADCLGPSSVLASPASLLPHGCAASITFEKTSWWKCMMGLDGCNKSVTCELRDEFPKTMTYWITIDGVAAKVTETETMCDY